MLHLFGKIAKIFAGRGNVALGSTRTASPSPSPLSLTSAPTALPASESNAGAAGFSAFPSRTFIKWWERHVYFTQMTARDLHLVLVAWQRLRYHARSNDFAALEGYWMQAADRRRHGFDHQALAQIAYSTSKLLAEYDYGGAAGAQLAHLRRWRDFFVDAWLPRAEEIFAQAVENAGEGSERSSPAGRRACSRPGPSGGTDEGDAVDDFKEREQEQQGRGQEKGGCGSAAKPLLTPESLANMVYGLGHVAELFHAVLRPGTCLHWDRAAARFNRSWQRAAVASGQLPEFDAMRLSLSFYGLGKLGSLSLDPAFVAAWRARAESVANTFTDQGWVLSLYGLALASGNTTKDVSVGRAFAASVGGGGEEAPESASDSNAYSSPRSWYVGDDHAEEGATSVPDLEAGEDEAPSAEASSTEAVQAAVDFLQVAIHEKVLLREREIYEDADGSPTVRGRAGVLPEHELSLCVYAFALLGRVPSARYRRQWLERARETKFSAQCLGNVTFAFASFLMLV
eukprot:g11396.t1